MVRPIPREEVFADVSRRVEGSIRYHNHTVHGAKKDAERYLTAALRTEGKRAHKDLSDGSRGGPRPLAHPQHRRAPSPREPSCSCLTPGRHARQRGETPLICHSPLSRFIVRACTRTPPRSDQGRGWMVTALLPRLHRGERG